MIAEAITRSKVFLTVLGVEREQTSLHPQRLDQLRRGRDFVALLVDHQMAEHDLIGLPQRRQHRRGLAVAEGVESFDKLSCRAASCRRRRSPPSPLTKAEPLSKTHAAETRPPTPPDRPLAR